MDINNINSNPLVDRRGRDPAGEEARTDARKQAESQAPTSPERSASAPNAQRSPDSSAGDQVTLSPKARNLKQLEAHVGKADAFDRDRVEQIRSAIAEGRYHVDAERLADKFIELESLLDQ